LATNTSTGQPYRPPFPHERRFPYAFRTWLLLGLMRLLALLPLAVAHGVGNLVGALLYLGNRKRRHIARTNLDLCFPDIPAHERERMLRRHFRYSAKGMLDLGRVWWNSPRSLERMVSIIGGDQLDALLAQERNIILLTGHFAGMDLAGIMLSRRHPSVSMMKAVKNPLLNWYLWYGRTRFGLEIFTRDQGIRPLLRATQHNKLCYYIPDEDFGARDAVFAPFFGIPTATLTALGRMAKIANAAVLPCFCRMLPWGGGYEVILLPPLADFPGGDEILDAAVMNAALETGIRMMPEQYMWTLKLFQTRPTGDKSPY